jgi:hypothetical protein
MGKGLGLAAISEARASACVSIYSRMFVSLPFRTVMAKTQSSSNVLFVALILPVAKPTTRTRSLTIFGRQRQQILLIAAAECRKKILHNLDILFDAHRNLSISFTSSVSDLIGRLESYFSGQITPS